MDPKNWPPFSLAPHELLSKIKIACVFGPHGNESLLVTTDDEVYGTGAIVALSRGEEKRGCVKPHLIRMLCGKRITAIASGSRQGLLLVTETGKLYTWGTGAYRSPNSSFSFDLLVGELRGRKVQQVACGQDHGLVLCDDGEVYAFGQNIFGQLGSGSTKNQTSPRKVIFDRIGEKTITAIACSRSSSFAVTDTGEVYSWGCNSAGELGIGNWTNQLSPVPVMSLKSSGTIIIKLVCGSSHALALSNEGVLYAWGSNGCGQLGSVHRSNSLLPINISNSMGMITDVAAVHYCDISAAMTQDFKVYMWGLCGGQIVSKPMLTPYKSLHDVFLNFATPRVTYKPLNSAYINETITESIRHAFDDPTTSDLTIFVENKPIYVHKTILKLRCEHFRTMFQDHWIESNKNVLTIDRSSYLVYSAFLQYLYTDSVELVPELALELMDLAVSYCETTLKSRCEEIIKLSVNIDNVAILYSAAIAFQSEALEDFCFSFALRHLTAVTQTQSFAELDGPVMKQFILKASKHGALKN